MTSPHRATGSAEYRRDQHPEAYETNAQYYEVIFPAAVREAVGASLRSLLPGARTVLEGGAGTGLFSQEILETIAGPAGVGGGELFAVEPSAVMRAALVTRLAGHPAAGAVTVLREDILNAELPGDVVQLDAFVMLHMLTHLSPEVRGLVWDRWLPRLAPGGLVVVDTQWPQQVQDVPPTTMPGKTMGRHRFETIAGAEVSGPDRVTWNMTYRTLARDRLIDEESISVPSYVVDDRTLDDELGHHGCRRETGPSEAVRVWRRSR